MDEELALKYSNGIASASQARLRKGFGVKRFIGAIAVFAVVIAGTTSLQSMGRGGPSATALAAPSAPCTFPTVEAATPEVTAWQLFIAANCAAPANPHQLVWESWVEQSQFYFGGGPKAALKKHKVARLHGSPLAAALRKRKHGPHPLFLPNTGCGTMNGPPPNLNGRPQVICEEVHINPAAVSFISGNGYQVRSNQAAAAKNGTDIEFPTPAVEVKVDWIPATDFATPFTCSNPPRGLHVEPIGGVCYVLAGMHIASKLEKNWIWATFEPQSMLTNPLRCITFVPCIDRFGSLPALSNGGASGFTKQTQELAALMSLSKLAPEFSNYRLDGVQIAFTKSDGTPTYLGNSVIEGENVGMTINTASCITCHSISSVQTNGADGINLLGSSIPIVGPQATLPAGFIARDFVWSLSLAQPTPGPSPLH